MDPTRPDLPQTVVQEVCRRFKFVDDTVTFIGGFQNFVYEGIVDGEQRILRIASESHRTMDLVSAEINFLLYLKDEGLHVPKPHTSHANSFCETVEHEGVLYIATAFERVPGRPAEVAMESDTYYKHLGTTVAKMHGLSRSMPQHVKDRTQRYDWDQNPYLKTFHTYVPADLTQVHERFDDLIQHLSKLPKSTGSFGLIHGDLNQHNYFVDGEDSWLIDFDQCEYGWFASDIAIPLFYETPIPWVVGERRVEIVKRFWNRFMEGYSSVHSVEQQWLNQIPLFIELRQFLVLSAIYRSYDFKCYDTWPEWDKQALKFYLSNVQNETPYLGMELC